MGTGSPLRRGYQETLRSRQGGSDTWGGVAFAEGVSAAAPVLHQ